MSEQLPLTTIGIVVLVAFGLGAILKRFGQNPVLGYILAGIVLGPLFADFLEPGAGLAYVFGEIGLFVLLFYLGLELSLKKFLSMGSTALVVAVADLVVLVGVASVAMLLLGHSALFAVTIGVMLFCNSTAVVAKFIFDKKMSSHPASQLVFAILILQDFVALLALVFISSLSSTGNGAASMSLTAVVFVVAAFTAVRQLSIRAEKWLKENKFGHSETTLYALGIGLLAAILGGIFGLGAGLGAYFAGFALSDTSAGNRIKSDLGFLREFFLLFFFVAFGTQLFIDTATGLPSLPTTVEFAVLIAMVVGLVALVMASKFLSFGVFGRHMGLSEETASTGALLLTPLGEFGVIVATAVASVLAPVEARMILPLAFLLILVSVLSFGPAYAMREHHQRFITSIRVRKKQAKREIAPHTPDSLRHAKSLALNLLTVACLGAVSLFVYDKAPAFNIPVPYSRATVTAVVFLFLAFIPLSRAYSAFKRLLGQAHLRQLITPLVKSARH